MFSLWQVLVLIGAGVLLAIICVLIGGWIVFKSRLAAPGDRFIGPSPKGQVFTIPDAELAADFPDGQGKPSKDEEAILKNTERFLNILGGKQ